MLIHHYKAHIKAHKALIPYLNNIIHPKYLTMSCLYELNYLCI